MIDVHGNMCYSSYFTVLTWNAWFLFHYGGAIVVGFIKCRPLWVVTASQRALVQSDENITDPWSIFFV